MGYHVHILRTRGVEKIPITEEEVSRLLSGNPDFRENRDANGEAIVELSCDEESPSCLWFSEGELWTRNPDERTIDAMCKLAALLGGRVRGDELETYRSSTESYCHPDDEAEQVETARINKETLIRTKRGTFVMNCCIFGTFLVLGLIVATCSR